MVAHICEPRTEAGRGNHCKFEARKNKQMTSAGSHTYPVAPRHVTS